MALSFCVDDRLLYEEILEDFVSGCAGNKQELDEGIVAKNWQEFEIRIHALKSAAKTIGAAELSGMALELEQAAEEKNEARILEGYPGFAREYTRITEGIQAVLNNKACMTEE